MKIQSDQFGLLEVDPQQCLEISEIIGFENYNKFALLDGDAPFYWLQSLELPELCFVLLDPRIFHPNYALECSQEDLDSLEIKNLSEELVFSIITIHSRDNLTSNLLAPLIVNKKTKKGKQVIAQNELYTTRHNIFEEFEEHNATALVC